MYSCILKFPINTQKSLLHVRSKLQDVVMHFTYFLWLSFLMIEVARGHTSTNLVVSNYNSLISKLGMKSQNWKLRKFNTDRQNGKREERNTVATRSIYAYPYFQTNRFFFLFIILHFILCCMKLNILGPNQ